MSSANQKKRGGWTEEDLQNALEAIKKKEMSDYKAAAKFGVPRRTLRRYSKSEATVKTKLGRKFTLSESQTKELCDHIVRLSNIGYPVTMKILRLCVYKYCEQNNIPHRFSDIKQVASHKWARGFMKANPMFSISKSQNLNHARAPKLNKAIVEDHFQKLTNIFQVNKIFGKPERIFNMDEIGCKLHLDKDPWVLAKSGMNRVPFVEDEHEESVTIVSCVSAIGTAVPPMILYKGKIMKPEYEDDLPPGSVCHMSEKGSMTSKCFVDWLQHFARFKPQGCCLLIFDGAKYHLDYEIIETAEQHDTVLYCLPLNTTHELQPLNKSVFRSFEYHWDQELMLYWQTHGERILTKQQFGEVFTKAWDQCMIPSNIKSGFRDTGVYPFDPTVIPEEAFAPSKSHLLVPDQEHQSIDPIQTTSGGSEPNPGPSVLLTHLLTRPKVLYQDDTDHIKAVLMDSGEDWLISSSPSEG